MDIDQKTHTLDLMCTNVTLPGGMYVKMFLLCCVKGHLVEEGKHIILCQEFVKRYCKYDAVDWIQGTGLEPQVAQFCLAGSLCLLYLL